MDNQDDLIGLIDGSNIKPRAKKKNFMPLIVLAGGFILASFVYLGVSAIRGRSGASGQESAPMAMTSEDLSKRQLTSFVEQFLLSYYNYSYTLYDQSVKKAEGMMTPAMQDAYNDRANDLDFKRKLQGLRVSTDAIRILPGSLTFGNQGDKWLVRLSGVMTFTTGINGVSGEFPLNLLLALQKTDTGFLVDNVERLR